MRRFRDSDLDAHASICADPEVIRFLGGLVMDRVTAQRHLARLQKWESGYGQWALEERATGAMIGHAGFSYPDGWPGFELGWVLARDRWGNGFATEAGTAALEWAFSALRRDRVISLIELENKASVRVAERLGMSYESLGGPSGKALIYAVHSPEAGEGPSR